ncbi:hypothetical protein RI367_003846 [Sorochytrium milnesiophthora]
MTPAAQHAPRLLSVRDNGRCSARSGRKSPRKLLRDPTDDCSEPAPLAATPTALPASTAATHNGIHLAAHQQQQHQHALLAAAAGGPPPDIGQQPAIVADVAARHQFRMYKALLPPPLNPLAANANAAKEVTAVLQENSAWYFWHFDKAAPLMQALNITLPWTPDLSYDIQYAKTYELEMARRTGIMSAVEASNSSKKVGGGVGEHSDNDDEDGIDAAGDQAGETTSEPPTKKERKSSKSAATAGLATPGGNGTTLASQRKSKSAHWTLFEVETIMRKTLQLQVRHHREVLDIQVDDHTSTTTTNHAELLHFVDQYFGRALAMDALLKKLGKYVTKYNKCKAALATVPIIPSTAFSGSELGLIGSLGGADGNSSSHNSGVDLALDQKDLLGAPPTPTHQQSDEATDGMVLQRTPFGELIERYKILRASRSSSNGGEPGASASGAATSGRERSRAIAVNSASAAGSGPSAMTPGGQFLAGGAGGMATATTPTMMHHPGMRPGNPLMPYGEATLDSDVALALGVSGLGAAHAADMLPGIHGMDPNAAAAAAAAAAAHQHQQFLHHQQQQQYLHDSAAAAAAAAAAYAPSPSQTHLASHVLFHPGSGAPGNNMAAAAAAAAAAGMSMQTNFVPHSSNLPNVMALPPPPGPHQQQQHQQQQHQQQQSQAGFDQGLKRSHERAFDDVDVANSGYPFLHHTNFIPFGSPQDMHPSSQASVAAAAATGSMGAVSALHQQQQQQQQHQQQQQRQFQPPQPPAPGPQQQQQAMIPTTATAAVLSSDDPPQLKEAIASVHADTMNILQQNFAAIAQSVVQAVLAEHRSGGGANAAGTDDAASTRSTERNSSDMDTGDGNTSATLQRRASSILNHALGLAGGVNKHEFVQLQQRLVKQHQTIELFQQQQQHQNLVQTHLVMRLEKAEAELREVRAMLGTMFERLPMLALPQQQQHQSFPPTTSSSSAPPPPPMAMQPPQQLIMPQPSPQQQQQLQQLQQQQRQLTSGSASSFYTPLGTAPDASNGTVGSNDMSTMYLAPPASALPPLAPATSAPSSRPTSANGKSNPSTPRIRSAKVAQQDTTASPRGQQQQQQPLSASTVTPPPATSSSSPLPTTTTTAASAQPHPLFRSSRPSTLIHTPPPPSSSGQPPSPALAHFPNAHPTPGAPSSLPSTYIQSGPRKTSPHS